MFERKMQIKAYHNKLVGIITFLVVVGLIFIYSSSSVYALETHGTAHYFVKKQLIGLALGLIGLMFFRSLPLEMIKRLTPLFYLGSLALTCATLTHHFAQRIHGSSRWIALGPIGFQPSELLRICFIMYLSYFLAKQSSSNRSRNLALAIIIALPALILLRQPDFGMTVTICTTALMLFCVVNTELKPLFLSLAGLACGGALLIYSKPYRWKRILTFLDPWSDPQGAGFQIIQSLIAIGSGNLWGIGIGNSCQKFFYLPMQHTDFIFSIIAEETGFLGCTVIILSYFFILYYGMRLAWELKDPFSSLVTLGFVFLTTTQAFINIAVASSLVPTKGIGLPFVSYGNSALICGLCLFGLVLNCAASDRS